MIDPILTLAFTVQSNKGIYALLLGSGVSRSSGIPTGWEIVLDLIHKLAHLKGENCEPNPEEWYKDTFGEEPDYTKLLDEIGKSPSERSQLLRSYFEPSEEELKQGLKIPMEAHKSIANMVVNGYIRVIVTTNFDRLIEKALESVGVEPTVISTLDAIEGALPLTHTNCTIIKVHGDYLDTRIKNTPNELAQYDERMNNLLDRVFDEYGLIICGWSAEWDVALRATLERCINHRFTTYWTLRGNPNKYANKLISIRRAHIIKIEGADSFFKDLKEKVTALQEFSQPHPISAKVATATLKNYLNNSNKIALYDIVNMETEKLYKELCPDKIPLGSPYNGDELIIRVQRYEALTEILRALLITGCYWGDKNYEYIWTKCLSRIANTPVEDRMINVWSDLRLYPALLLFYSGGIASIASNKYETFNSLLFNSKVRDLNSENPFALKLYTWFVMNSAVGKQLPGMNNHYAPVSDRLFIILRESLREFLPDDMHYQKIFDRFEYLLALVHLDTREKNHLDLWAPIGRFGLPSVRLRGGGIMTEIESEANEQGNDWPPLQVGLFDGSIDRFRELKGKLDQVIRQIHWI